MIRLLACLIALCLIAGCASAPCPMYTVEYHAYMRNLGTLDSLRGMGAVTDRAAMIITKQWHQAYWGVSQ